MKLLKLAAILLACSGAALAQATLQCTSFPCQIQLTAAQCPSGLPCSITITNGPKFTIGDRVAVTHAGPTLAVRLTAASSGALLGVQPNGRTGMVVAGPIIDLTGDHKTRWQLDYAVGVDGWSVEDYLERTATQPPPPPVCIPPSTMVNGVCTVPPPQKALLSLSPPVLDLGAPAVGVYGSIRLFTVTNKGTADLVIISQAGILDQNAVTPGFSYGGLGTCNETPVPPGAACTISVRYKPAALGVVTGTLTLTSNAVNAVQTGGMTGGAVQAPAKSVTLKWIAPVTDGAASYNLYRSSGSGGLVKVGNVVGSLLTFTDTPVPSGTYNYVATTVNSAGDESLDSNSVLVIVP